MPRMRIVGRRRSLCPATSRAARYWRWIPFGCAECRDERNFTHRIECNLRVSDDGLSADMWLRGFMFTRYVTFIFLVGLSALFFSSGRSAPIDKGLRNEVPHSVTAAEQVAAPA